MTKKIGRIIGPALSPAVIVLNLIPLSVGRAHGLIRCRRDPVAIDPGCVKNSDAQLARRNSVWISSMQKIKTTVSLFRPVAID